MATYDPKTGRYKGDKGRFVSANNLSTTQRATAYGRYAGGEFLGGMKDGFVEIGKGIKNSFDPKQRAVQSNSKSNINDPNSTGMSPKDSDNLAQQTKLQTSSLTSIDAKLEDIVISQRNIQQDVSRLVYLVVELKGVSKDRDYSTPQESIKKDIDKRKSGGNDKSLLEILLDSDAKFGALFNPITAGIAGAAATAAGVIFGSAAIGDYVESLMGTKEKIKEREGTEEYKELQKTQQQASERARARQGLEPAAGASSQGSQRLTDEEKKQWLTLPAEEKKKFKNNPIEWKKASAGTSGTNQSDAARVEGAAPQSDATPSTIAPSAVVPVVSTPTTPASPGMNAENTGRIEQLIEGPTEKPSTDATPAAKSKYSQGLYDTTDQGYIPESTMSSNRQLETSVGPEGAKQNYTSGTVNERSEDGSTMKVATFAEKGTQIGAVMGTSSTMDEEGLKIEEFFGQRISGGFMKRDTYMFVYKGHELELNKTQYFQIRNHVEKGDIASAKKILDKLARREEMRKHVAAGGKTSTFGKGPDATALQGSAAPATPTVSNSTPAEGTTKDESEIGAKIVQTLAGTAGGLVTSPLGPFGSSLGAMGGSMLGGYAYDAIKNYFNPPKASSSTPTAPSAPTDTTTSRTTDSERGLREAEKVRQGEDVRLNVKSYDIDSKGPLIFKSPSIKFETDKLEFETDKLEFVFREKVEKKPDVSSAGSATPSGGGGGAQFNATPSGTGSSFNPSISTPSFDGVTGGQGAFSGFSGSTPTNASADVQKASTFQGSTNSPSTVQDTSIPAQGRGLLNEIARTEGGSLGYNAINYMAARAYGRSFSDYSKHPFEGKRGYTAAGRYQFIWTTWSSVAKELNLTDFSPKSQDAGCWYFAKKLYSRYGNLEEDLKTPEKYDQILQVLRPTWHGLNNSNARSLAAAINSAGVDTSKQDQSASPVSTSAATTVATPQLPSGMMSPSPMSGSASGLTAPSLGAGGLSGASSATTTPDATSAGTGAEQQETEPDAKPSGASPTQPGTGAGTGGGGNVRQSQSGIRKLPLSDKLNSVLQQAARTAGVDVTVTSGGQPAYPQGPRTGSTRHDLGNAADLDLYAGGRILSDSNPADIELKKKFVGAATAAGASGIGAGYMGPTKIHVGFGTPAKWGGAPWLGGITPGSGAGSTTTPSGGAGGGGATPSSGGGGGTPTTGGAGKGTTPMDMGSLLGNVFGGNKSGGLAGMAGSFLGAALTNSFAGSGSQQSVMDDATTLGSSPSQDVPLFTTIPDYPSLQPLTPDNPSAQIPNTPQVESSASAGMNNSYAAMSFMAGPPEDFFSSSGFTSVTPDPNFYGPGGKSGFSAGRLA